MDTDPDLLPIQSAAERYAISLSVLYRYLREGRLSRYRRGFDRVTYVDSHEIDRLRVHTQAASFTLDLPTSEGDSLAARFLSQLQRTAPQRKWSRAGWGHAVWVNGQKAHAYTVFRYIASNMEDVMGEVSHALDIVDPAGRVDRHRIRLARYPFETTEPSPSEERSA